MSGRRARRGVAARGGSGRGGRDGAAKPVTQSQPPDQISEAAEDTAPAETNVSQEEFTDTSIVEEMKDENVDDGEAEEGNADKTEGNADEAEGNVDGAEGNADEAEGNMDEAEGIMDEAEGNGEVIDVDMELEEETEQEVIIVNDGSKDDKKKADSGQEDGGKKRDKKKDDKWVLEVPKVDLVDIPPYDPQSVREKFKWTIRIYPVSVDDAMLSGLPAMTKVQDAFIHINRRDPKQGQMEFGMTKTPDAIVMMLRILRTPLVNGMITIEVVKRGKPRRDTAHSDGGDAESADKEGEEDGMKDTGPETKDEADGQSGNGPKQPGGRIPYHALPWSVVMDKAVFMVDLAKAQKIKFVKHVKGDIRRRAVFVGNMPRGCTEELFKVIFPMANGILFRATDDPHKRKAFIETCHRFNAMGFVQSYPAMRINDVDFKLSLEEDELENLLLSEDASRSGPSTGDGEKTREEQPVKVEKEEEKVKKEEEKKGETKTPENEKKEDGKDKQNGEKKTQGSSKPAHVLAKRKQKRKRDFQDEIQREWHSQITSPRGQQASQQGNRGRGGSAGQSPRGSMARGGVGSRGGIGGAVRGRVEAETRGRMRDRVGPGGRSGLGGRGGMGVGRTMDVNRSLGAMRAGAGIMGQAPQPPMSNLEGKIQNLMRLQNQLELTIHNQMNYLDQAQQTRQQLAITGLGALAVGNVGGGMSLGDQRAANLNTSGFGRQASDRNKSRWRNRNRNKQGGKSGGNNKGSVRSSGEGVNQGSSRAVGRDGRDQHRPSGGQQGGRFSSPSGENPSPKRFRRDSAGNAGVGGNRFGGGDDRFGRSDLGRDISSFGERDSLVRSSLGGGVDSFGIGSQSSFIERDRDRYRGDGGEYSSGNLNTSWGAGSSRDYGLRDSVGVGGVGYSSSSYSGGAYSSLSARDSYLGSMSRDYGGGSLSSSYLDDYARPSLSTYSDSQNLLGGSALGSSYSRY